MPATPTSSEPPPRPSGRDDVLSRTLAALADPTRRAMLEQLALGPASVSDLARGRPMSLAAVSKHLRVLEAAGLVKRGRVAQYRPAQIELAPLDPALAWISRLIATATSAFVEVERAFEHPPASIWDAWTRPELFASWFGTEAVEVPVESVTLDVRIGGELAAEMVLPDGSTQQWSGTFVEVAEPSRLVFTLTDEPGSDAGAPLVVRIDPADAGSRLVLRQSAEGFDDEGIAALHAGYGAFFDAMERVLDDRAVH
jgi:uncharacterized protein YndB with AHSA1/START domain